MKVSLPRLLFHNPGLLQEVILDVAPRGIPLEVKIDVHVFPESTRVVVPICLGVSECFHDLIGPNQDCRHSKRLIKKDERKRKEREKIEYSAKSSHKSMVWMMSIPLDF